MARYVHAVPNFSEGRRAEVIDEIVGQVRDRDGVKLIAHYPDPDFNRTVVEVIGQPGPLKEALLDMAGKSYDMIDMNTQRGDHPRIGAQDSIPVFPLANITLGECVDLAEEIGKEVFDRYAVPVYFSGENARCEERTRPRLHPRRAVRGPQGGRPPAGARPGHRTGAAASDRRGHDRERGHLVAWWR